MNYFELYQNQHEQYLGKEKKPNKAGAKIFISLIIFGLFLFFLGAYYLDGTHNEFTNAFSFLF